jgi:FkbM family methyltransferase
LLKEFKGTWLPEDERHMLMFATEQDWGYQDHKLLACLAHVRKFDVAVDVGAHCGLWSRRLTQIFKKVYAFEPVPLHREAFIKNVQGDYELMPYACGDEAKTVFIKTVAHSSGDANIDDKGDTKAQVVRIDDVLRTGCDFLKIDTEGYEELVLRGAKRLLKSRPCVIVEQKPKKAQKYGLRETGAVRFLKKKGAELKAEIEGDYIMAWNV